jgi:hypothetical protein
MGFQLKVPFFWLNKLTHENGKPNFMAILLLAYLNSEDIKPQKYIEGELNPYYDQGGIYFKRETLAKIFKCTKRNISFTLKYLEDKRLIERIIDRQSNLIKRQKLAALEENIENGVITQSDYKREKEKIKKSQNTVHSKLYIIVKNKEVEKLNTW